MFERPEELNEEAPLRIVFLSVEGNKTEQNYFEWVEKYREKLGIKARVHVHSLRRSKKDTFTSYEVSKCAGHSKGINEDTFKNFYLPKVDFAIRQTKAFFSTDIEELIGTDESDDTKKGKLGSNLPSLFDLLREM